MAGFTDAYAATVLDAQIIDTDLLAWSEDGLAETTHVAKTALTGGWDAATVADPSVIANATAEESAASDADSVTISHYAVFNAAETVQKTEWTALTSPRTLDTGDKLTIAAQAIEVTLS